MTSGLKKRGVSEMISYALIVLIVMSLMILVYAYLQLNAPKERLECTEDISLIMREGSCSVLGENSACGIKEPTIEVAVILENKGNQKIDGAFLRLGAPDRAVKELINKDALFFNQIVSNAKSKTGLLPGESKTFITRYTNPEEIQTGLMDLEIQPFVGSVEKTLICDRAVVSQRIRCSEGNVLPQAKINQPSSGKEVVISDLNPEKITFTLTASDCDGEVTKVELWERPVSQSEGSDSRHLTSVENGLYTLIREISKRNGYRAGEYSYTAVVYDNKGTKSFSEPVIIKYTYNNLPTVTLTIVDEKNQIITQASTSSIVKLRASAADSDGTINEVRFYEVFSENIPERHIGTVKTSTKGSYDFTLSVKPSGDHLYRAQAIDNQAEDSYSSTLPLKITPTALSPGSPVLISVGVLSEAGNSKIIVERNGEKLIESCTSKSSVGCETNKVVVGDTIDVIADSDDKYRFSAWTGINKEDCKSPQPPPNVAFKAKCTLEIKEDTFVGVTFFKV